MSSSDDLAEKAADFVESLPRNVVRGLVNNLMGLGSFATPANLLSTLAASVPPELRRSAEELASASQASGWPSDASVLGLMLDSASRAQQRYRDGQSVEVVWSGPVPAGSPLRRTEQALLEAISKAKSEIWLLSFVAYKVEAVRQALVDAIARGVSVNLLLETVETSEGRIDHDGIAALKAAVGAGAIVYEWPTGVRPKSADGRSGVLHAKACLVDAKILFSSSANMTGNAFSLNMELGMLVRGGTQPQVVAEQLAWLIESENIRPCR